MVAMRGDSIEVDSSGVKGLGAVIEPLKEYLPRGHKLHTHQREVHVSRSLARPGNVWGSALSRIPQKYLLPQGDGKRSLRGM